MYKIKAAVQFIDQKCMVVFKIKAVKGEPTAKANDEVKKMQAAKSAALVGRRQSKYFRGRLGKIKSKRVYIRCNGWKTSRKYSENTYFHRAGMNT